MKTLLAVLLAALMLFSLAACGKIGGEVTFPDQTQQTTKPDETQPEIGHKIGNLCPSFQVETGNAQGPTGEYIDPTAMGKVTIINFWGTWCNPCTSELPHFDRFARENDVKVIAIHSVEGKRKMPEFIEKSYGDSPIIFAYDQEVKGSLDRYFTLLGGSVGYPYTVVLDAEGIVLYTHTGMMTYEQLEEIIHTDPQTN